LSIDNASARFMLVSYLPTYAAVLFLLFLFSSGAPGRSIDLTHGWAIATSLNTTTIILVGLGVALLSVMLHPLQLPLVRLWEGYWPAWCRPLAWLARRRHRARRDRMARAAELPANVTDPTHEELAKASTASTLLAKRYPAEVRPTALGNVLAATEEHAGAAYGWDAVVAWPRLYPILGEQLRRVLDDRRDTMDATIRLTAIAAATAVVSAALVYRSGPLAILGVAVVPLMVAWIAYHASVHSALAYGEAVEAAFDLHRLDLVRALHVPLPEDPTAEVAVATQICDHWRQGVPMSSPYRYD
jgi:hypothetical protein